MDTNKVKIDINTDINVFGEAKTKSPPVWLYHAKSEAKKITPVSIKRSMLLDGRKWKKADIEKGCYAVARYELALFATRMAQLEKDLIKTTNTQLKKNFKKSTDIVDLLEKEKDKKLQKIFDDAGKEAVKQHAKIVKMIEDKVSLALDEVESDKGDNKKSMSAAKDALRKFNAVDFKATFVTPSKQAALALAKLSKTLSDPKSGEDPKKAIDAALKSMKDAESDFEKKEKKAEEAIKAILDLGDKLENDKGADPALNKLGTTVNDKSPVGKSLRKVVKDLEMMTKLLDDFKNDVSAAATFAGDETKMNALASPLMKKASLLEMKGVLFGKSSNEAVKQVAAFQKTYKEVAKDLKT